MPKIPDFFALNEVLKPAKERVYHNNSTCPTVKSILATQRRNGTSGYRICEDCKERNDRAESSERGRCES